MLWKVQRIMDDIIAKKQNKEGFTLIELLAVIIIMSALTAIAVPIFIGKAEEARLVTDNKNKQILLNQAQIYMINQSVSGPVENMIEDMVTEGHLVKVPENPFESIEEFENKEYILSVDSNGRPRTTLAAPFDGVVNAPDLLEGMTPVKYNGTDWVEADASNVGNDWYQYNGDIANDTETDTDGDGISDLLETEKWANIVLEDGSMFVWIPRYTYKVTYVDDTDATNDKIEIRYSKGLADDLSGGYATHPAFNFGGRELTGIWVAKFNSTYDGIVNDDEDDDGTKRDNSPDHAVRVLPNVTSWRFINIGNAFEASRNMELKYAGNYGINDKVIDTHLMKNTEWGAVSYLAEAIRDGEEIWTNNYGSSDNSILITGKCSVSSKNASKTNNLADVYSYNESLDANYSGGGAKASTTGNIYGVYDLVGISWENVASYIDNKNGNLNAYGNQLIKADDYHKNVLKAVGGDFDNGANYTEQKNNNYSVTSTQTKGMAIHEINPNAIMYNNFRTYEDLLNYTFADAPFFIRGGSMFNIKSSASGIGAVMGRDGNWNAVISFRPTIVPFW